MRDNLFQCKDQMTAPVENRLTVAVDMTQREARATNMRGTQNHVENLEPRQRGKHY